jgi:hypothetical protein
MISAWRGACGDRCVVASLPGTSTARVVVVEVVSSQVVPLANSGGLHLCSVTTHSGLVTGTSTKL